MKRIVIMAAIAAQFVVACGSNKITWDECVSMCGGDGNVCSFSGDGESRPDGTCVCKDKSGNCPGDAGVK